MTTEALERVDRWFRLKYRISVRDVDISDTPGYWQDREARMHPGHPLHGFLFCDGPFKATYTYFDPPRVNGRFASPTRTWAAIRSGTK